MPLRRPVGQVECWATNPGSGKPPWNRAADLAEQIRIATYDRTSFGRLLAITENGVVYPAARVFGEDPHRAEANVGRRS